MILGWVWVGDMGDFVGVLGGWWGGVGMWGLGLGVGDDFFGIFGLKGFLGWTFMVSWPGIIFYSMIRIIFM